MYRRKLPPEDILPLTCAAIRLFAKQGNRTNRSKARLRHVRECVGDAKFIALLHEELQNGNKELLPGLPEMNRSNRKLRQVTDLNL
jgi:sulfite reductase beta subunit-like hemoprotein